jgi:MFS family permease
MSDEIKPWVVCLTAALFFFFIFIQINAFNAINLHLASSFGISAAKVSQLSSYYFIGNIVFLFPAGMILDRCSVRRTILLAFLLTILATFIFAITDQFWLAAVCRLIIGLAGAFVLLSCIKLATRWLPPQRMALITGLVVTMAMFGGMVAQTPLTLITDHFGWRDALLFDAGLGVICWLLIFAIVRDYPDGHEEIIAEQKQQLGAMGFWRTLGKVMLNPQNWYGGLFTSLINLPIFLLGALWGVSYLAQAHNLTRHSASYITSMLFVGMIVGSPVLGWFSDFLGRRRRLMIIGAISALLIILLIIYLPNLSFSEYLILFFLLGFIISSQNIGYPLVAESNPPAITATAMGLASTLIMAGGLTQPLFGWLMDLKWDHTMVNGTPVYSVNDYHLAMLIMPIAFVIALIMAVLAKETYCITKI